MSQSKETNMAKEVEEGQEYEDLAVQLVEGTDNTMDVARAQVYATLALAASIREAASEMAEIISIVFVEDEEVVEGDDEE